MLCSYVSTGLNVAAHLKLRHKLTFPIAKQTIMHKYNNLKSNGKLSQIIVEEDEFGYSIFGKTAETYYVKKG